MWAAVYLFVIFSVITYFLKKMQSLESSSRVKYYFNFGVFYCTCLLIPGVCWPLFLFRPKDVRNANIVTRIVQYIVNSVINIKWILRDGHHLSEDRGAVIVSNHQLTLDILGMGTIWDHVGKIASIAKKQLLYVFPFGLTAYLCGTVFIDRNNPKSAYKELQKTSDLIVKNKTKIWFFPEGTRNKDYRKLLPFKKGAFSIAVAAQAPIIPVVYSPYYFINAQKHIFDNGHIIMQALEPIPTVGLTNEDIPDLIAKVHEQMSAVYKELSKEVLNDLPVNYSFSNVG